MHPLGKLADLLHQIEESMNIRIGSALVGARDLRAYNQHEVVLIKQAARRHWIGGTALEDADLIIEECFPGREYENPG